MNNMLYKYIDLLKILFSKSKYLSFSIILSFIAHDLLLLMSLIVPIKLTLVLLFMDSSLETYTSSYLETPFDLYIIMCISLIFLLILLYFLNNSSKNQIYKIIHSSTRANHLSEKEINNIHHFLVTIFRGLSNFFLYILCLSFIYMIYPYLFSVNMIILLIVFIFFIILSKNDDYFRTNKVIDDSSKLPAFGFVLIFIMVGFNIINYGVESDKIYVIVSLLLARQCLSSLRQVIVNIFKTVLNDHRSNLFKENMK